MSGVHKASQIIRYRSLGCSLRSHPWPQRYVSWIYEFKLIMNYKITISIFALLSLIGCETSPKDDNEPVFEVKNPQLNPQIPENYNVLIVVKDEEDNNFQALALRWGFSSDQNANKFELQCSFETCYHWEVGFEVEGEITLMASGFVATSKYCSDYFYGEKVITANPSIKQEVKITVYYEAKACA